MHIKIMANEMMRALSTAMHALSSKNTQPQLDGVLISTTKDGRMRFVISNGKMSVECFRSASIIKEGRALFPARLLYDLIRRLDGEVEIECDSEKLKAKVMAEGSKTDMRLMEDISFPNTPNVEEFLKVEIKQKAYASAIKGVIFAAAVENLRKILKGCLMEITGNELSFVALDGFRVAIQRLILENGIEGYKKAVLPCDTLGVVSNMVDVEGDENIIITVSDRFVKFDFNSTTVYSPLLLGEYIDYKQLLPTSWTTSIRLNRQNFISAVERSSLFARFVNNLIRMRLDEDFMHLSVSGEKGNVDENVPISFEGQELLLGFNSRYLMDVLKNIDENELFLHFNSNLSPCLICPVKGDKFSYLVLPVRLIGQDA